MITKFTLTLTLLVSCISIHAASPVYNNFYGGQFLQTGNNLSIIGNGLTNVNGTNITFYGTAALASATNSLRLANDYALLSTATDVSITNVVGQISGQHRWTTLWISNSAATAKTVRFLANGRAIGSATTNSLSVGAAKMAVITVESFGNLWTNYSNSAEQ